MSQAPHSGVPTELTHLVTPYGAEHATPIPMFDNAQGSGCGALAIHTIRLRGPWQCEALTPAGQSIAEVSVELPGDWHAVVPEGTERVRLKRRFNAPTGLEPQQPVHLVIQSCTSPVNVLLGEVPLTATPQSNFPLRLDVTEHLQLHNELVIETLASGTGELGLVTLEISDL